MLLSKDDKEKIKLELYEKRDFKYYNLIELLLDYGSWSNVPDSKKKAIDGIPRLRQTCNQHLKYIGYEITSRTFVLQKIQKKDLKTLIKEIDNFIKNYQLMYKLKELIIFNSYSENEDLCRLEDTFQKLSEQAPKCEIKLSTVLNENIIESLKKLNYVNKKMLQSHSLNLHGNLRLFYCIIIAENAKFLFLFDDNNYVVKETIDKPSYIFSIFNNHYKYTKGKPIKLENLYLTRDEEKLIINEIKDKLSKLKGLQDECIYDKAIEEIIGF